MTKESVNSHIAEKGVCLVNFVWGEYQEFIPLYFLMFGETYSEYDAIVYFDGYEVMPRCGCSDVEYRPDYGIHL